MSKSPPEIEPGTKCSAMAHNDYGIGFHGCHIKAKIVRGGKPFCGIHDPGDDAGQTVYCVQLGSSWRGPEVRVGRVRKEGPKTLGVQYGDSRVNVSVPRELAFDARLGALKRVHELQLIRTKNFRARLEQAKIDLKAEEDRESALLAEIAELSPKDTL